MTSVQELVDRVQEAGLVDHNHSDRPPWGLNNQFDNHDGFDPVTRLPDDHEFDFDEGDGEEPIEGNILDQQTRRELKEEVENDGVEALAYYIPFHSDPRCVGHLHPGNGLSLHCRLSNQPGHTTSRSREQSR